MTPRRALSPFRCSPAPRPHLPRCPACPATVVLSTWAGRRRGWRICACAALQNSAQVARGPRCAQLVLSRALCGRPRREFVERDATAQAGVQGCCSSRRRSSRRQLQVSLPLEDHRIPQPSRAWMWSGMVHTIHHWPHPIAPPCDLLAFLTATSWACVPCPLHVHVLLRRSCDERCGEQTQRTCLLAVLQTTAPRGQDGLALCLPGRGALHV